MYKCIRSCLRTVLADHEFPLKTFLEYIVGKKKQRELEGETIELQHYIEL